MFAKVGCIAVCYAICMPSVKYELIGCIEARNKILRERDRKGLLSGLRFRGLYKCVEFYFRVYTKIFLHGIGCVVILGFLA